MLWGINLRTLKAAKLVSSCCSQDAQVDVETVLMKTQKREEPQECSEPSEWSVLFRALRSLDWTSVFRNTVNWQELHM